LKGNPKCTSRNKRTGYYDGAIRFERRVGNAHQCEKLCCENVECKLWVFRSRDSMCHLKDNNDLRFHSANGHVTSLKETYYNERTWYYLPHGAGVPARCAGVNKIECASNDGRNCLWGSVGSKSAYSALSGVRARNPLVMDCPGWKGNDGSDSCDKLGCTQYQASKGCGTKCDLRHETCFWTDKKNGKELSFTFKDTGCSESHPCFPGCWTTCETDPTAAHCLANCGSKCDLRYETCYFKNKDGSVKSFTLKDTGCSESHPCSPGCWTDCDTDPTTEHCMETSVGVSNDFEVEIANNLMIHSSHKILYVMMILISIFAILFFVGYKYEMKHEYELLHETESQKIEFS